MPDEEKGMFSPSSRNFAILPTPIRSRASPKVNQQNKKVDVLMLEEIDEFNKGADPSSPKTPGSNRPAVQAAGWMNHSADLFEPCADPPPNTPLSQARDGLQPVHSRQNASVLRKQTTLQRIGTQSLVAKEAAQKYSVPLLVGVIVALAWSNADSKSYHDVIDAPIFPGFKLLGHEITFHFLVNDIFMCFFFGLAIKEVTEALLPGGSLSPLKKAINPLLATFGGVIFPAVMYLIVVLCLHSWGAFDETLCSGGMGGGHGSNHGSSQGSSHGSSHAGISVDHSPCKLEHMLAGWGVPTATDISLAWMGAVVIFGKGHPVINFLLLLAILDDALGMMIIAVAYPDPHHPPEPVWLLLVLLSMGLALGLRCLNLRCWPLYLVLCGPVSWLGLLLAHVHPALALVFVVPFLPARALEGGHEHHSPLEAFEHRLKLPVDLGMCFFGLANAGVRLGELGGVTAAVLTALILGKVVGIAGCSLLGSCLGFPLPQGMTALDVVVMAMLAGIGLTVALFVSGEAFVEPGLQGEAKMGALLSVTAGFLAAAINWFGTRAPSCPWRRRRSGSEGEDRPGSSRIQVRPPSADRAPPSLDGVC